MSLEAVGLTGIEERLYRALLDGRGGRVAELARALDLPQARVREGLAELERKGLVSRTPGRSARFTPAPPDLALESLVLRRVADLEGVRREAAALAERHRTTSATAGVSPFVELVTGYEATLRWAYQVQRAATREVRLIDVPPHVLPPVSPNATELELLSRGVAYRVLYHETSFDVPGKLDAARACIAAGEEARVYSGPPLKLIIADEVLAFAYDTRVEPIADSLIVHPSFLLEQLVALFDLLWASAVSLPHGDAGTEEPWDDLDREILALLAAGAKDDRIARQLGIGLRTVRRRVGRITTLLGARTRFQAGALAARSRLV